MNREQRAPIVVADTTPLNYLVQLDTVDLLQHLFGGVLIPSSVHEELLHPGSPRLVREWASEPPEWLNIRRNIPFDADLAELLDPGEREAISLADQVSASFLLVDELAARRIAEKRRLRVIGTMAVLLEGSLLRDLDFPALVNRRRLLKFRMSPQLEDTMLARYRSARLHIGKPDSAN